ncbi:MAG TPA: GxxExxY protein [Stellaceae bacterium]|nr:GxxExxY protein [Stellaceae bacterium]
MIPLSPEHDSLAHDIVDSAFAVHRALGPGLLESVYERCLAYELQSRGFKIEQQVSLPVVYRDIQLEAGFRIDLLVNGLIVAELRTVERLLPIHEAQLLTYLKLSAKRLGLLLNFNVPRIKDGIRRLAL